MISVTRGQTCSGGAAMKTSVSVVGQSAKRTGSSSSGTQLQDGTDPNSCRFVSATVNVAKRRRDYEADGVRRLAVLDRPQRRPAGRLVDAPRPARGVPRRP